MIFVHIFYYFETVLCVFVCFSKMYFISDEFHNQELSSVVRVGDFKLLVLLVTLKENKEKLISKKKNRKNCIYSYTCTCVYITINSDRFHSSVGKQIFQTFSLNC